MGLYQKMEAFPHHPWVICEDEKAGPSIGKQRGFDKGIREITFPDSS